MVRSYFEVVRPYALGFLALLVWNLAEGLPWPIVALLLISAVFLAAGGFVMNDYFDVKIDRINRPELLVVTRTMSKDQAIRYSIILTTIGVVAGLGLAYLLHDKDIAIIYVMVPGLMWFYSSSYKRQLLLGNLIIASLVALIPVVISLCSDPINQLVLRWALPLFLVGLTLILLLDIRDQEGERELECHTLPVVMGDMGAKIVLVLLMCVTVASVIYIGFFAK